MKNPFICISGKIYTEKNDFSYMKKKIPHKENSVDISIHRNF